MANVKISNVKCPALTSLSLNGSEMSLAPPTFGHYNDIYCYFNSGLIKIIETIN